MKQIHWSCASGGLYHRHGWSFYGLECCRMLSQCGDDVLKQVGEKFVGSVRIIMENCRGGVVFRAYIYAYPTCRQYHLIKPIHVDIYFIYLDWY